jgi:hypothetical protein
MQQGYGQPPGYGQHLGYPPQQQLMGYPQQAMGYGPPAPINIVVQNTANAGYKPPVEAGDEGCLSIESRATEDFRCNLGGLPRRSFRPEAVPIDRETRAKLPSWTAQKLVDEPFDDQRRARRSARARGKIGSPTYGRPAVPRRARDRGRRERPRRLGAEAVATRRSARFNEETGKTARIGTRVTPGRETA